MTSTYYYVPSLGNIERTNGGDFRMAANRIVEIDSDISREIGISDEIQKNASFAGAMADPGNFLTNRGTALTNLKTALDTTYSNKVIELVREGFTNEEAIKTAKKVVQAEYELGLKRIDRQFPVNVEKLIKGKFDGRI